MTSKSSPSKEKPAAEYKLISIDLIDDPAQPMRKDLTPESVEDLVISIRQVGIIEPLVVKAVGKRYEVIAGHRRLVASGVANLAQVPCYILKVNREQTEILKIHENLYRADVKPTDEAEHFKFMILSHKLSPTKLGKLVGRSESYVSDRLAILNYPPRLKAALDAGKIKYSVAREFSRMQDLAKMREYLHYAIRNGITTTLARQWVTDYRRSITQQAVEERETTGGGGGEPMIESYAKCIYCKHGLKLAEANVVYIHDACLDEANAIEPAAKEEPTSPTAP